jgi:D-aspartate ligase
MRSDEKNIIPVILGADLNAYSVALSFRDSYGIRSHIFARYASGATSYSSFITVHICEGLDDPVTAVDALLKFAAENNGAELFLIPSADWYVEMLERAAGQLEAIYQIFIPKKEHFDILSDKAKFYSLLEKEGIAFPEYLSLKAEEPFSDDKIEAFTYPAVLKPSDSVEYWRHPFPDMKKVYFPRCALDVRKIAEKIFSRGYKKTLLLQRYVGSDSGNRVLTTVSDRSGRVFRAVLGEVVLEEMGATSFGNHAAIITRPLDEVSFQLIRFLDKIGYVGIANIDIMYSEGKSYVLELNPRQGRSSDYLRAAGVSLSEAIVSALKNETVKKDFSYKAIYWHHPSHKTVMRFSPSEVSYEIEALHRKGFGHSPYDNPYEGIRRKIYSFIHAVRLHRRINKTMKRGRGK